MQRARILDLATLMSYAFEGSRLHNNATKFFEGVEADRVKAYVLTLMALEAETVFMSKMVNVSKEKWFQFIDEILANPKFVKVPLTAVVFKEHLKQYRAYGGRHSYFDSFYCAFARLTGVPLITSDKTILDDENIPTDNLSKY